MGLTVLICRCGRRIKAPGAKPGRVGRCPSCGNLLEVPLDPTPRPPAQADGEANPRTTEHSPGTEASEPHPLADGYFLEPSTENLGRETREKKRESSSKGAWSDRRNPRQKPIDRKPIADGFLPVLDAPEQGFAGSCLFPLRGADPISLALSLGTVFWILLLVVPEYCLGIYLDADDMGVPTMGLLVMLISAMPSLFLTPLVVVYLLQYLARVLVTGALGETAPPRLPDRNLDGLLSGLSPWLIWFVLGLFVGFLPLIVFISLKGNVFHSHPIAAAVLFAMGFPYAIMALLMSFLHDHPFAANPPVVVWNLIRHGSSFLMICVQVTILLIVSGIAFSLAFQIRDSAYLLYFAIAWACIVFLLWAQIVIMRILGLHYFRHKDQLRWNQSHPRWGVRWRL